MRKARAQYVNWKWQWGHEGAWCSKFNECLVTARDSGRQAVDQFLQECQDHAEEGREMLHELQFAAQLSDMSTHDEIRDLFLQGYQLTVDIMAETKFFEIKVNDFAPAVPSTKSTDMNYYYNV